MRTAVSPRLRRRPLRNDIPTSPKLYPAIDSPEKSSDEDEESALSHEDCDIDEGFNTNHAATEQKPEDSKTKVDAAHIESTESKNVPSSLLVWVVITVVCLILGVVLFYFFNDPTVPPLESSSKDNTVTKIVQKLKDEFVSQPSLSLRIIKNALSKVIASQNESQPSAPAILLLMSSKGAKSVTTCFAKQLASLVAVGDQNYQIIHGCRFQGKNPDKAKRDIDNLIIDAFQSKEQKVILIEDLDLIPYGAAMMLHSYCDHENAPHKDVVYIMTIDADTDLSDVLDSKELDRTAESRLTTAWKDTKQDSLSALLSRITVSVVAILHKAMPSTCR